MNYLFLTHGTDGDVHPFVGLGKALIERGHSVTMFTNEHFEELATRHGLGFVSIGSKERYRGTFQDPAVWKSIAGAKILGRWMCESMIAQYEAVVAHNATSDTVLVASGAALGARIAHDKLGIPMASIVLQPAVIRSAKKMPVVAGVPTLPAWVPPGFKRVALRGFELVADRFFCISDVNAFRARLGLAPVNSVVREWWLSPHLVVALFPDWFAMPQSDWAPQIRTTGFPLYDDPSSIHALSDDVQRFVDAGDPPIAFTPGTGMMHGRAFFDAAVGACRILGRRGLLLTRHTAQLPPSLPDFVRHVHYAPFSELLPRTAAMVHHGGVGTLAQACAAGIPQLIMPMAYDQPDNASRLKSLGVGDWLKRRSFRAELVAHKLRHLLESDEVAAQCATLAKRIDRRGGLTQACQLLEGMTNGRT